MTKNIKMATRHFIISFLAIKDSRNCVTDKDSLYLDFVHFCNAVFDDRRVEPNQQEPLVAEFCADGRRVGLLHAGSLVFPGRCKKMVVGITTQRSRDELNHALHSSSGKDGGGDHHSEKPQSRST